MVKNLYILLIFFAQSGAQDQNVCKQIILKIKIINILKFIFAQSGAPG